MSFPKATEGNSLARQVLVDGDAGSAADRFAATVGGIIPIKVNGDIALGHARFPSLVE
jgi:hypothetical protein